MNNKENLEQRLEKYKNRMELVRTIIGMVVLCIQIMIVIKKEHHTTSQTSFLASTRKDWVQTYSRSSTDI